MNADLARRFGMASDVTLKDYWIPRRDGSDLRVRIYRKIDGQASGALLYVHGGGMILSSIEDYDARCMHYCTNTGIPVVSVDYPLAPEAPYPAQIDDALIALRWMHENATDHGWDPARIGIAGDSAGGGLAAGAVLKNKDDAPRMPDARLPDAQRPERDSRCSLPQAVPDVDLHR